MTDALVRVIHPITGEEMHLHPDIANGNGVWLPPDASDIDDATLADLKSRLDIAALKSELVRFARRSQRTPVSA